MALSDYEKQVLEQMEADLRRADPDLASQMSQPDPGTEGSQGDSRLSPRRIAAGSVLALAGLGVVLTGVALGHTIGAIALGVLGFVMMVGGVLLALRATPQGRASRDDAPRPPRGSTGGWSHFIADQERRWEDRGQG